MTSLKDLVSAKGIDLDPIAGREGVAVLEQPTSVQLWGGGIERRFLRQGQLGALARLLRAGPHERHRIFCWGRRLVCGLGRRTDLVFRAGGRNGRCRYHSPGRKTVRRACDPYARAG